MWADKQVLLCSDRAVDLATGETMQQGWGHMVMDNNHMETWVEQAPAVLAVLLVVEDGPLCKVHVVNC